MESTKKRALTAGAILLGLIALFAVTNMIMGGIADRSVTIDGKSYPVGSRSLHLTLMTEEGLDSLSSFGRLTELSITPYIKDVKRGIEEDGYIVPEEKARLLREADELYAGCTTVTDISFLTGLDVEVLSLAYCDVSDLSPLASMPSLKELDISHTKVEDLRPLMDMPRLERVTMSGVMPTEDQLQMLRAHGFEYEPSKDDEIRIMIRDIGDKK